MTFRPHLIASLVAASLAAPTLTWAADATWAPTSGTGWATGANWTPTSAPGATSGTTNTDTATFNNNAGAQRTVTVDTYRNLRNIIINQSSIPGADTTAYVFSTGALRLTSGGAITYNSSVASGNVRVNFNNTPITLGDGAGGTYSFISNRTSGANASGLLFNAGASITGAANTGNTMVLTLDGNSPTLSTSNGNSIRSVISDGGAGGKLAVTKAGSGNWVFYGAHTYTGATTINAGTLMIFGPNGSIGSGSAVAINNGGTLAGAGAANGAVTLNSGGHLQAGNLGATGAGTVGTITLGSLSTSGGGILDVDFTSTSIYDVVAVTGALSLTGTTSVNLFDVGTSNPFDEVGTYTLITASSISGFNASSFNVANAQSGFTYTFNSTGTGITLNVQAVPEPSTYALLGLGLGAVLWRARRLRKS